LNLQYELLEYFYDTICKIGKVNFKTVMDDLGDLCLATGNGLRFFEGKEKSLLGTEIIKVS